MAPRGSPKVGVRSGVHDKVLPAIAPLGFSASIVHDGETQEVSVEHDVAVSVGDKLVFHLASVEGGPTYVVDGLPKSASTTTSRDAVEVGWTPTEADIGEHDVHILSRVGARGEPAEDRALHVLVEQTGHTWFTPGAIASVFVPEDVGRLGVFVGGGAELVLYSFVDRGPGPFGLPSHGRLYLDVEALASAVPGVDPLVMGRLGFDLSLERDPHRRFLIPFLGAEVGFAVQKQRGGFGFGMPLGGVYLWTSPLLRVALSGGYLLPTTAAQDVRGPHVSAVVDIGW